MNTKEKIVAAAYDPGESSGYDRAFFERRANGTDPMPLLASVCRDKNGDVDCAVICGMYRPISDDLRSLNFDLRLQVSRRWWCHNHPPHACRGNALVQGRNIVRAMTATKARDDAAG